MKRWKGIASGLMVLALGSVLLTAGPTSAETIRLRVAGQYAEDHPATQALKAFEERVEAGSDGTIDVRVYPANQLGDYTQVYEELRRGTIDMALISVPSQFDPRLELLYLHYVAMNYDEARKMYGPGSFVSKTMDELHGDLGVKYLGIAVEGFGGLGLTKLPETIKDPQASKDLLLRVPPMDVFKLAADDQGFQTETVPYADLYTALQTGVAEGWSGGPATVNYLQFRDVISHFVVVNNFFESNSYLMSQQTWEKLSAEQQKLVQDTVNALSAQSFDEAEANDNAYLDKLAAEGVEIVRLSDEELKAWADNARAKTWPNLRERLTPELIDGLSAQY